MNIEQKAAETLLNKGIKVRVSAPLLLRLVGIKSLRPVVRAPYWGTLNRITLIIHKAGLTSERVATIDDADIHELYAEFAVPLNMIMAQAILNNYWLGKVFGKLLGRFLVWHSTPLQTMTIANVLVSLNSKTAFTNTIRWVQPMTTTKPTLSQASQGS